MASRLPSHLLPRPFPEIRIPFSNPMKANIRIMPCLDMQDGGKEGAHLGDGDVAGRWFESPAGVIVGDNDGGGAVGQGVGEDFVGMHGAAAQGEEGPASCCDYRGPQGTRSSGEAGQGCPMMA